MVKHIEYWRCDLCQRQWKTKEAAEACEVRCSSPTEAIVYRGKFDVRLRKGDE